MYFKRGISLFLCLLFCFSMVPGVFAVEKIGDDMNDFDHYTVASKIAYEEAWYRYRTDVSVVPEDMHSLKEVKEYFTGEKHHINAGVVNLSNSSYVHSQLDSGDIIHVKNSEYAFMVYRGVNSDGNVVLESLNGAYICDESTLCEVFDGAAIKFVHDAYDQEIIDNYQIDGGNITDTPLNDPNLNSPSYIGESQYVVFWKIHQFDPYSTKNRPIMELAYQLTNGVTSDLAKALNIFNWVQNSAVQW